MRQSGVTGRAQQSICSTARISGPLGILSKLLARRRYLCHNSFELSAGFAISQLCYGDCGEVIFGVPEMLGRYSMGIQKNKNQKPAYLERRAVLIVECTTAGQWYDAEFSPSSPRTVPWPALVVECLRVLIRQLGMRVANSMHSCCKR